MWCSEKEGMMIVVRSNRSNRVFFIFHFLYFFFLPSFLPSSFGRVGVEGVEVAFLEKVAKTM